MGMVSISPGAPQVGFGGPSADEAQQYADWQNAGGQGDFQYNPGLTPAPQGLPTDGMSGGKGMPGAMMPATGQSPVPSQQAQPQPTLPMMSQPFPNQQQPITQGTGQLPPGFGALSPIDRSQIAPGASIGMTGQGGGQYGRDLSGAPGNMTTINSQNRLQPQSGMNPARNQFAPGQPGMPSAAPVNRFAPPNAPGVRPSVVPTTNRQMTPLQQAQFGGAGQLGSARANMSAGGMPARPMVSRSPLPVRRTK